MHFSSKQEQLRQLLKEQHASLQQTFPLNRFDALLALVHASTWHYLEAQQNSTLCSVSPSMLSLQKALSLCFSVKNIKVDSSADTLATWADSTLRACTCLAEAERILEYCDSGFMHMQQGNDTDYNVWVASKKMPTEWCEHEDFVWITNFLKQQYATEWDMLYTEKAHIQQQLAEFGEQWNGQLFKLYKTTRIIDDYYQRLGALYVKCMVGYATYPASTFIGGCTFAVYRDVLGMLIGLALKYVDICRDRFIASSEAIESPIGTNVSCPCGILITDEDLIHRSLQCDDALLIETLAAALALDRATVRLALDAYTLDAENVSYHASTTEVPMAPLIRLDEQHRVVLLEGLLTYPLFFLIRELKRKYSYEYHTASQVREEMFRQDIYTLFGDKRFVKSAGHVELRGTKGTLTTDVDALIFDRKTGALALFELKSQDPFAYSPQERIRQRNYFYNATKQVIASSEWVKHNGANALLSRLDLTQIKRLKAQNVYIFVLGRYLAHFFDGPPFDVRAAWGTWSQVLRLVHGRPFSANDTNPIQSLHNKLTKDTPLALDNTSFRQEVVFENECVRVYPSFGAYRSSYVE